jgi:hypothetical protein
MMFRLLAGEHTDLKTGRVYRAGSRIESDQNLSEVFGNEKFRALSSPAKMRSTVPPPPPNAISFPAGQVHSGRQETTTINEAGDQVSGPIEQTASLALDATGRKRGGQGKSQKVLQQRDQEQKRMEAKKQAVSQMDEGRRTIQAPPTGVVDEILNPQQYTGEDAGDEELDEEMEAEEPVEATDENPEEMATTDEPDEDLGEEDPAVSQENVKLDSMKVDELRQYANQRGINLEGCNTKAQVLQAVKDRQRQQGK